MVIRRHPKGSMPAAEFKAKCLQVMDRVAKGRQPLVVTKRGKPVVRIIPIEDDGAAPLGCLAERFQIVGDIESPILPAWEGLE